MADIDPTNTNPNDPTPVPQASAPSDSGMPAADSAAKPPSPAADAMLQAAKDAISQLGDINSLMAEAMQEQDQITSAEKQKVEAEKQQQEAKQAAANEAKPLWLEKFEGQLNTSQVHAMEMLGDVQLQVKIELGRTRMLVEDVLRLGEGAVVELDKLAGDPVDVYVNERHVARGEVLVLNDNFCVRINEILTPSGDPAPERGVA
jgi:flagellar motor switch protein FliN